MLKIVEEEQSQQMAVMPLGWQPLAPIVRLKIEFTGGYEIIRTNLIGREKASKTFDYFKNLIANYDNFLYFYRRAKD